VLWRPGPWKGTAPKPLISRVERSSSPALLTFIRESRAPRIEAPPCGLSVHVAHPSEAHVSVSDCSMQNELLRVEWDDSGVLTSIWDKEAVTRRTRG
jgi:hypothetical protein